MDNTIKTNLLELEEKLRQISKDFNDPVEICNRSIHEIGLHLKQLKEYVLETSFKTQQDEIHFFKKVKPLFTSKLIFYKRVKKLEINKPLGSRQIITEYYQDEMQKLKIDYDENKVFYDYYRLGNKYLDDKLFIRNPSEICPNIDPLYFEMDHRFATSHDYQVANILANELSLHYIEDKIKAINDVNSNPFTSGTKKFKLKWSLSKTNMVEAIYAFHAVGAFNNGNVEIKDIAEYWEEAFDTDLGNYYGLYGEIKERKGSQTKLLDLMKEELEKKIELQETIKR